MGKPRLIILIRHAQSEGNKNREIHQLIPDHRVKLTEDGWRQAEEAGRRLRHLLKPDDTLQIYTSPYRRTRETTEGLLSTLTSSSHDNGDQEATTAPSPFSRSKIKVYEEPRLREQDFGNFQPCSTEMERMWQERADYGHFFYRIPNGESAADAYDRVSGFNESLWRQFGDGDFPSVCVLVTHGLMTRVFLMKWYHWSVEYFEDLRNINHTEFVVMRRSEESGKYVLENQLRTWSELKRLKAAERAEEEKNHPSRRNTLTHFLGKEPEVSAQAPLPPKKWGGCIGGCEHHHEHYPRRRAAAEGEDKAVDTAMQGLPGDGAKDASNEATDSVLPEPNPTGTTSASPVPNTDGSSSSSPNQHHQPPTTTAAPAPLPAYLHPGHDGGGSGANTPHEMSEDDGEYFSSHSQRSTVADAAPRPKAIAQMMRRPQRKPTPDDIERWASESGMGKGLGMADGLGDGPEHGNVQKDLEDEMERVDLREVEEEEERRDKSLRGSVY